jgi:hypothetical protein
MDTTYYKKKIMCIKTVMVVKKAASLISLKKNCLGLLKRVIKINEIYSRHCVRDIKDKLLKNALILITLKKVLEEIAFIKDSPPLKNDFTQALDKYIIFVEYNFINNNMTNPKLAIINNNFSKLMDRLDLKDCYDVCLSVKKLHCTKLREVLRDAVQQLQRSKDEFFDNLEVHNNRNKRKESFTRDYLISFSKRKYFGFLGLFTNYKVHVCILKKIMEKDSTKFLVSECFDHEGLYLKLTDNDFMTHLMIVELHKGDVFKNMEIFFEEYEDLDSLLSEFILLINHLSSTNPNMKAVDRKVINDFLKFSDPLAGCIKKLRELTDDLKKTHIKYLKALELFI